MRVRIGTWNLEGKWSSEHLALLRGEACDLWLLTEVHVDAAIQGMQIHRTGDPMGPRKTWAAICSAQQLAPLPDPHRATAMAMVEGFRFMSSVLPWRSCDSSWTGSTFTEKLKATLAELDEHIDETTVWGGDWNQALEGSEYVGSGDGRGHVLAVTRAARLSVPTRSLGSAVPGQRSIDHIAVPVGWDVSSAYRVPAVAGDRRLSDHDAYVVSVDSRPRDSSCGSAHARPGSGPVTSKWTRARASAAV